MLNWFRRKNKSIPEAQEEGLEQITATEISEQELEPTEQESSPEGIREEGLFLKAPREEDSPEARDRESSPEARGQAEDEWGETAEMQAPSVFPDLEGMTEEEGLPEKAQFFRKMRERLHKTREQFVERVDRLVFGKKTIDVDLMDELEEVLVTSDLGVSTTQLLLDRVSEKIKRQELKDPARLRDQLRDEIKELLSVSAPPLDFHRKHPCVVMVVGVNGVGKTTTVGKLAHQLNRQGLKVLLVAGDTFRAAAIEQLVLWGERAGVPVIRQKSGSDPSAVAFDAIDAAIARNADVVLLDTAGRMHTKVNLMEELKKVHRVIQKKMPGAPHEVLLVLDATTGQNALSQVRLFHSGIGVTGLILTKLDGTAKGGIIVPICSEVQVPVRYIGIGEGVEDLRPFDPDEFTRALF